jgi:hypothetical protein
MRADLGKTAIDIGLVILPGTTLLGTSTFWFVIGGGVALIFAVVHFSRAKCPSCASRGTLQHLH